MKRSSAFALALVLSLLGSRAVLAQGATEEAREVEFRDADTIEGRTAPGPEESIRARGQYRRTTLIRARSSFVPELRESLESH